MNTFEKQQKYVEAAQSMLDYTDILVYRAMEQNIPVDNVLVEYRDALREIAMYGVPEYELETFQFPIYPYDLGASSNE